MRPSPYLGRLVLAAVFVAGGCRKEEPIVESPVPTRDPVVSGTVAYRERSALPPDAVVIVRLVDVSRADAAAVVLGEQRIEAAGRQVPFAFAVPYDPSRIEASHEYAVQARIELGGRLLFISDQRHPVLTRGAPASANIVVRAIAAPEGP